eukprot:m51a1_g1999 hypothetical protein (216) ;mRNA; f:1216695-1217638
MNQGRKLLVELSRAVSEVGTRAHVDGAIDYVFVYEASAVTVLHRLVLTLESALTHRLITSPEATICNGLGRDYGEIFALASNKRAWETVNVVATASTPRGKARAWIIVSLFKGLLREALTQLLTDQSVLEAWYAPDALLRDDAFVSAVLGIIAPICDITYDAESMHEYMAKTDFDDMANEYMRRMARPAASEPGLQERPRGSWRTASALAGPVAQ